MRVSKTASDEPLVAVSSKRREAVAKHLFDMFTMYSNREDVIEDGAVEVVMLKCDECQKRKVDTDHHMDFIEEGKVFIQDKEQRFKDMANDLKNTNLSKAVHMSTLIASSNRKPLTEIVPLDVDELKNRLLSLERKLDQAKDDILKEELEAERTFHRCKYMLQDKMVMSAKIDDTTRNLKYLESILVSQNALMNPRNKQFEEIYAQAELQIEQEAVGKNLIISDLSKREAIAHKERIDAVDSIDLD
jgi:hypothetical protein